MEKPAFSGRKSVRSCEPPTACQEGDAHKLQTLTFGEDTDGAALVQTLENRAVGLILLDVRQGLVLQPALAFCAHPRRGLDIAVPVFTRDGEFSLKPKFRVRHDGIDCRAGIPVRLGSMICPRGLNSEVKRVPTPVTSSGSSSDSVTLPLPALA